jgi:hypothetical protein
MNETTARFLASARFSLTRALSQAFVSLTLSVLFFMESWKETGVGLLKLLGETKKIRGATDAFLS